MKALATTPTLQGSDLIRPGLWHRPNNVLAVLQAETDLHRNLKMRNLAIFDMAATLAPLKPLDVLGDGVADGLIDAVAR